MFLFSRRLALAILALLIVALGAAAPVAQSAQSATTFSGRATALKGTIYNPTDGSVIDLSSAFPCQPGNNPPANANFCVADTGPVAAGSTSANLEANAVCYAYPNASNCLVTPPNLTGETVAAEVLHATVVSRGDTSRAEASAANFSINAAGQTISADLLHARASAKCTGNGAVVQAGGETTVTINGTTYTIAAGQTQRFDLVNAVGVNVGYVIVNEGASGPKSGNEINASALHVVIPGVLDVTVAAVHADIVCAALLGCPSDHVFVTGGGFFNNTVLGVPKAHFAVAGGKTQPWGHVLYKPTGLHVKKPYALLFFAKNSTVSDVLTTLGTFPEFSEAARLLKTLSGTTKLDGGAILYWTNDGQPKSATNPPVGEALALDLGEPGRSDFFEIAGIQPGSTGLVSLGGGFLNGGNIQMHGAC